MSFPYTEEMMESVKKVEATRAARMAAEPRRMTAEEKDALLEQSMVNLLNVEIFFSPPFTI